MDFSCSEVCGENYIIDTHYTIKTSFKTLVAGFIPYYLSDKLFLVFITDLNYLTFYDSTLNHRYTIGIGNANVNRIYPRFASL